MITHQLLWNLISEDSVLLIQFSLFHHLKTSWSPSSRWLQAASPHHSHVKAGSTASPTELPVGWRISTIKVKVYIINPVFI